MKIGDAVKSGRHGIGREVLGETIHTELPAGYLTVIEEGEKT